MATTENLPLRSISDMSDDELIEHLRQTRQARRAPPTTRRKPKKSAAVKQTKRQATAAIKKNQKSLLEMIALLKEDLDE